ncbi:Similar to CENPJ: Centromere protein J (Homo sapiens) [Cotesia congregata]|uniref:Similar to CENPJ: Centromere protein J (Homo sapiens) n=1 Tax=Cotesia congregata TaxID=51543 RepID=A0A8J2EIG7_COTCN|nr:Similar to CENPJ: Centromere protein J (Homo sapiens) [Cotesia congregata]
MSVEASIVERLQELRKWQLDQQDRLLKQQQEQRDLLNIEQKRMYEALGLSIDDINDNLTDEMSLTKIQEHLESLPSTGDKSDAFDESSQYKSFQITEIKQPGVINSTQSSSSSDEFSEKEKEIEEDNFNLSVEGVKPFPKRFSTGSMRIDDIPVPSPKKDFKTLLEEKLKDSEALGENSGSKTPKVIKKQPFLRKGEGLARFRLNKTPNIEKVPRTRAKSLPPIVKNTYCKSSAVNRVTNQKPKEKITKINKNSGISRRSYPLPKVAQQKLNLKNVPLPKNIIRRSISPLTKKSSVFPPKNTTKSVAVAQKISDVKIPAADESDLDSSKLETKMFEFLEEKAENSSFCSTSSAVVAFLQQSTPLKLKSIRKNLVMRKQESQEKKSRVIDDEIEELVHSLKSNKLEKLASDKSKKNFGQFSNEGSIDNNISSTPKLSKNNFTERKFLGQKLEGNYGGEEKIEEIGIESDSESEKNYEDSQRFKLEDKNLRDQINDGVNDDGSMHVRFSEYNEYKMIGLTDTSTISRDSFIDDKNWTDDSSVESSEVEILTSRNFNEIQKHNLGSERDDRDKNRVYESTDDEESMFNETESTVDEKDDTITEIKNSVDNLRTWNAKNEEFDHLGENNEEFDSLGEKNEGFGNLVSKNEDYNNLEEKKELVLKSELLKNRLLELEREIEIFRKENAALSEKRQKLDQERRDWEKELKEKEDNLRREQSEAENNIQEEKRRMIREKAALENRLRDAREKSIQAKQDRQEIERLKDQLAELRDDFSEKENLWLTEQARQRSQIRVLQMENGKLKQEISKFQESRQSRLKKPSSGVLQAKNSNKMEVKKITFDDQVENNLREKDQELERVKYSPDRISSSNSNRNLIKPPADVLKKRELYKNLIKEAAGEYYEEDIENIPENIVKSPDKILSSNSDGNLIHQLSAEDVLKKREAYKNLIKGEYYEDIENIPENIVKNPEKPKILTPTYRKNKTVQDNFLNNSNNFSTQSTQTSLELKSTVEKNDINKRIPRLISEDLQLPHGSYQQFVREVINPVTTQYSEGNDGQDSRQVQQESPLRVPVSYLKEARRSPEVNGLLQGKQTPNYVADRRIDQTKFVDGNESDISPRVEKIPLPRPTDSVMPCPSSFQISCVSNLTGQEKIFVPKQNVREVLHPDGRLEYWYPNGNVKKVFPDSNTSKMIYYNGDVRETLPDVSFPDGSIRLVQPDGITKWALPDGTIAETFPNGDKILSLPNGQREIHTADHKRREYPDGTVKFVYNDGTQETRYANGRIRIKDRDGQLLFDSHHPEN